MITGRLARGALRDERKKSGCTQQQIADMLGIDRSTYSYYESGRLQVPQDVLLKLAEFYDMPVSVFFTESSDHVVFHSDTFLSDAQKTARNERDRSDTASLTYEEKRLLSQLRARSCFSDGMEEDFTFAPTEIYDDAILSFLGDPDDT